MKSITLVTKGPHTCEVLRKELSDLLGDRIKINSYYLDGNIEPNITDDLIVFSSMAIYEKAKKYLSPECPFIIAKRSIDYNEIGKLLYIDPGTDVLLVNDSKASTEDTISLLKELGFTYINYFPYYPGKRNPVKAKIAITPGESELVPKYVEEIIDISIRKIDFTTMIEILKELNLSDKGANLLSARFIRDIISLLKKIKLMADKNSQINNQLQTILNTVHDGIIAFDNNDLVTVCNPVAEKILHISKDEIIGKKLTEELSASLKPENTDGEVLLKINNRDIVLNNYPICTENTLFGRMCTLKDVTEIQKLEQELRRKLRSEENHARYTFNDIVGKSKAIVSAKELSKKLSKTNNPILIQGESGTGKELFAQAIHNNSDRANGPFVALNFAALPESLLESELFGFDEGAFTGAKKGGKPGLFEQAHEGTIFLDEIGDAPLSFQIRLLRVLQEKVVRRVGGSKIIPIDIRVISATNKNLKAMVEEGLFRQDLYYRLNVLPLKIPPLRERKEDIIDLAKVFYYKCLKDNTVLINADDYFKNIEEALISYDWPGNIRELINVVEYLVSISREEIPSADILPEEILGKIYKLENHSSIERKALLEIYTSNNDNTPIGRRSLSKKLNISENKVRSIIDTLNCKGFIQVNKGIKGIKLTDQGIFEVKAYRG